MQWQTPFNGLFSNDWLNWFFSTYGFFVAWVSSIVGAILKIIAIRNPNVPTNGIMDLIKVIFRNPAEPETEIKKGE